MLPSHIDAITENHINTLVDGGVRQSRTIAFKKSLNIGIDADKKEFLADVSSFANANGGYLIIGIEDNDGIAVDASGIDGFGSDEDLDKIEGIIRKGIDPPVIGLQIKSLPMSNGRNTLLLRIPCSLNRPHMVVFKGSSQFFSRNSLGKYPLDVHELRSAFISSEGLSEKIRQYRLERIDAILNKNTPILMTGSHLVCLHLIPVDAFNPAFTCDLVQAQEHINDLRPMYSREWDHGMNFDGLLTSASGWNGSTSSYVQLFRNGVIEAVDSGMLEPHGLNGPKLLYDNVCEEMITKALDSYRTFMINYGIPTPVMVAVSMLNVQGFTMITSGSMLNIASRSIDRDHLILPDKVMKTLEIDSSEFLRSLFDQIWHACGWSQHYNNQKVVNWAHS
jgi:hypothetical protein